MNNLLIKKIKCLLINTKSVIRGKAHRVSTSDNDIFYAKDSEDEIFFARLNRHNRYKKGIMTGINMLAEQYNLDKIDLSNGGLLIDCGANIGELGLWAKKNNLSYTAFEPEKSESDCICRNAKAGSAIYRNALWNKKERLTVHSLPNSGDSSIFDMGASVGSFEIDAIRLDDTLSLMNQPGNIILKVEAEGAEPEVLQGAQGLFDKIDYITVDCGPERGVNQEYTFVQVNNFLIQHGFELKVVKFDRVTALFHNTIKSRY